MKPKVLMILIAIFFIRLCEGTIFVFDQKEERWEEIKNYEVSLKKIEYNLGKHYILTDEEFGDVINFNQVKALRKLLRKEVPAYEAPMILEKIKVDFVNNFSFFYIKDPTYILKEPHIFGFYCAIEKNGMSSHRFGRFEFEEFKESLGYKISDITYFKEILNKEKLDLDDPALLLNWVVLFMTLTEKCTKNEKIVMDTGEIEKLIKMNCKEQADKAIKDVINLIHSPLYSREKDKAKIKLWFYLVVQPNEPPLYEEAFYIWFGRYIFEIGNNRKISPPPDQIYAWVKFSKGCEFSTRTIKNY